MHRQERQEAEQSTATSERLLAAFDEIELLHEQVESWRELAESLNLELQQTEQELKSTNQELLTAVMLERVSLDEAKTLAKTILKSEKSGSESLAELLTAIYGFSVNSEELQQIDRLSIRKTPLKSSVTNKIFVNSKEIRTRSKQLQYRYNELKILVFEFQSFSIEFKKQCGNFMNKSREKDNKTTNHSDENYLRYSPPPLINSVNLEKQKSNRKVSNLCI